MTRRSHILDLGGPVHYVDHGGDGPPLVLVHGLGGSHLNWESVAPLLARHHRVFAVDLVGFGLTPLASRRATVDTQRRLMRRFVDDVVGVPAVLMGNSMGGLIALVTAADHPDLVSRLVLVNPALPIVSARSFSPTALQRLGLPLVPFVGPASVDFFYHTQEPEQQVERTLELLCVEPDRVGPEARARTAEMLRLRREMEWATPAFTQAIRSVTAELIRRKRFTTEVLHRVGVPTLLVHGEADAIVAPASARWAARQRPDWAFHMLAGVGHVPMIEVPAEFAALVEEWLGAVAGV
jgi:pimeloyl-ACP methyl ester carboxylesterase